MIFNHLPLESVPNCIYVKYWFRSSHWLTNLNPREKHHILQNFLQLYYLQDHLMVFIFGLLCIHIYLFFREIHIYIAWSNGLELHSKISKALEEGGQNPVLACKIGCLDVNISSNSHWQIPSFLFSFLTGVPFKRPGLPGVQIEVVAQALVVEETDNKYSPLCDLAIMFELSPAI